MHINAFRFLTAQEGMGSRPTTNHCFLISWPNLEEVTILDIGSEFLSWIFHNQIIPNWKYFDWNENSFWPFHTHEPHKVEMKHKEEIEIELKNLGRKCQKERVQATEIQSHCYNYLLVPKSLSSNCRLHSISSRKCQKDTPHPNGIDNFCNHCSFWWFTYTSCIC